MQIYADADRVVCVCVYLWSRSVVFDVAHSQMKITLSLSKATALN